MYSKQWDFAQSANDVSNRSVEIIHEDCEQVGNTAQNSSVKSTRSFLFIIFLVLALTGCSAPHSYQPRQPAASLNSAVNFYAPAAETRLLPYFKRAGMDYPPQQIALLIFKKEKKIELWARDNKWKLIRTYPIKAASGGPGPKLQEGDAQVPEGVYHIVSLNPHSKFHLSMELSYPNSFDLNHAKQEGRKRPGKNIFIHGKAVSIGCIAIGDIAIEELFVLVYKTGINQVEVIIAPNDLRRAPPIKSGKKNSPPWLSHLYHHLKLALANYNNRPINFF